MQNLDAKDKLLLAALKINSRASIVSLARDIDLSHSATHGLADLRENISALGAVASVSTYGVLAIRVENFKP